MEQGRTYRLLIGDQSVFFRRGLRTILSTQPDLEIAAEAASLDEVIAKTQRQTFDLLLLSAGLIASAPGTLPLLEMPMVLLSSDAEAGPDSIPRSAPASQIVEMVRSKARSSGKTREDRTAADLTALADSAGHFGAFPGLTARESEIVRLLADQLTAREVAVELHLSIKTVEAHKLNAMRKLGMHNSASLIRFAERHGTVSTPA